VNMGIPSLNSYGICVQILRTTDRFTAIQQWEANSME
jgi:hypothetical protein